jgi:hypothetical protein
VRVIDGVEVVSAGAKLTFTKDDMLGEKTDNQTTTTDSASSNPTGEQKELASPEEASQPAQRDDWLSYSLLVALIAVTLTTFPSDCITRVTLQKVWYFGWITAVSTGLGVLPFYLFGSPNKYYMGIANGAYLLFLSLIHVYLHPTHTILYAYTFIPSFILYLYHYDFYSVHLHAQRWLAA